MTIISSLPITPVGRRARGNDEEWARVVELSKKEYDRLVTDHRYAAEQPTFRLVITMEISEHP